MTKDKSFNPGIKISVFFIFFAAVFFALGVWQIERGQNKQQVLDAFNNAIQAEPSLLCPSSKNGSVYMFREPLTSLDRF